MATWELEQWQPEEYWAYEYRAAGGGEFVRDAFRPDSLCVLRHRQDKIQCPERLMLCIEIDMATVSRGRFEEKLATVARVTAGGLARRWFGAGQFRYLVIAPTEARRDYLRGVAREQGVVPDEIILFSTFALVESNAADAGFLGRVWQTPEGRLVALPDLTEGGRP